MYRFKFFKFIMFLTAVAAILLSGCNSHSVNGKVFYLADFPGAIKMKNIAAGETIVLVNAFAGNFDVSRDGKKIVYASMATGNWEVYTADITNSGLTNIKNISNDPSSRDEDPKFSWDGKSIVFKKNNDIAVCSTDGSGLQYVTNTPNEEEWAPCFGPDGRIAFTRGTKENSCVYVWDGSKESFIASKAWFPAFTPSGDLLFVSINSDDDIYMFSFKSKLTQKLPFCVHGASDADPHWVLGTKDWCSFTSARSGRYEAYIGNVRTGEVLKVASDTEPILNPIIVLDQ